MIIQYILSHQKVLSWEIFLHRISQRPLLNSKDYYLTAVVVLLEDMCDGLILVPDA